MDDDLEILIASGLDPATALAASHGDPPRDQRQPSAAKQSATLAGLVLGIIASIAASWLLFR